VYLAWLVLSASRYVRLICDKLLVPYAVLHISTVSIVLLLLNELKTKEMVGSGILWVVVFVPILYYFMYFVLIKNVSRPATFTLCWKKSEIFSYHFDTYSTFSIDIFHYRIVCLLLDGSKGYAVQVFQEFQLWIGHESIIWYSWYSVIETKRWCSGYSDCTW